MINERPLSQFQPLAKGLVKPVYSDYAFGNIPNTMHFLLTGERLGALLPDDCFGGEYPKPGKIVLCFVDSFGWEFWQDYRERFRTLRHVSEQGILSPISALFPSTTSASVTTLNFGVLPSQHAVYEWNIYVPAYGEVIQSLPFTPLGTHASDGCLAKGYDPAQLIAVRETVHQRLAKHGVRSMQFAHRQYANSSYNKIANAGADIIQHQTLAEALTQLKEALLDIPGKAFLSFYWASIDTIAHIHGPGTSYHKAEIISFWQTFDHVFRDIDAANTLYLFTADHGQVYADAKQTIYINELIPGFAELLAVSPTGNLIYPNGSPRDVFLHVKPDRYSEALDLLHRHLGDEALILPIETALGQGLFGPQPICAEFRRRLGDILILPYLGNFIWWRQPGLLENRFYGHHGGLTPQEVITVLGAITSL
jgi:predicted AlkP superfamily pyrophosphatase or phosphodiesterase